MRWIHLQQNVRGRIFRSALVLAGFASAGCNGILGFDDGLPERDPCYSDDDCSPGRACFASKCRQGCGSESDCPRLSTCMATTTGGACVIDTELRCDRPGITCPFGTSCIDGQVCLAGCIKGRCFSGQLCRHDLCVDIEDAPGAGGTGGTGNAGGTGGLPDGCVGSARDCTSSADNDCDGKPDSMLDGVCQCAPGQQQTCGAHPGYDGKGACKAGTQKCEISADRTSSRYGACVGSVGPAAADSCAVQGNDANCNGVPNQGCSCVPLPSCAAGMDAGSYLNCVLKKDRTARLLG